jgi:hypothetical protein
VENLRKSFSNIKWKCMLYLPLILLLTASMALTNVSASPGDPYISVDPPKAQILAINQTVAVDINITDIIGMGAYDFWLYYNDTLLEVTQVLIDTDPANPLTETQVAPAASDRVDTDVSVSGIVRYSIVWKAGVPTYTGNGTAARITFKGKMVGNSTLTFSDTWTKAFDGLGDPIPLNPKNGGEIEVIPEFPVALIMPLLLTATLAAAFLAKMFWSRKHRGPATA